jgi:hypothetical protein
MPKVKTSKDLRLRYFVSKFGGNDVFTIDASILFSKMCECKVNSDKKFNVSQHLKTEKQLHTMSSFKVKQIYIKQDVPHISFL